MSVTSQRSKAGQSPGDAQPSSSSSIAEMLASQRLVEADIRTDLGLLAQAFDTYTSEGDRPNGLAFRSGTNERMVSQATQRQERKTDLKLIAVAASGDIAPDADRVDAVRLQRIQERKQQLNPRSSPPGNALRADTDAALIEAGYEPSPRGRNPLASPTGGREGAARLIAPKPRAIPEGGIPRYPLIHQELPYAMFRKFSPSQGDIALRRKAMPKVLIADDNKLHLIASKVVFQKYFDVVHVCSSGKGVLEAMQRTVYDLILIDYEMVGLGGNAGLASAASRPASPVGSIVSSPTIIKTIDDVTYSNYAPDIADSIRAVENSARFETRSLIVCMLTKEQADDELIMERCQLSGLDRYILKPLIHHVNLIRDAVCTSSVTETFRRKVLEKKWFSHRPDTTALLMGTQEEQDRVHTVLAAFDPTYEEEAHVTHLFTDAEERLQLETLLARQRDEEMHNLRDEMCTLRNEVNELQYRNEQLEVENGVLRKDQHLDTIWRLQKQVENLQLEVQATARREVEEKERARQAAQDLRNLIESGSKNERHVEAAVKHAVRHRRALEVKEQVCMELLDNASANSWYNYYGSVEMRTSAGVASETLPKFATDVGTSWFREQLSKMMQTVESLSSTLLSEVLSTRGDVVRMVKDVATSLRPSSSAALVSSHSTANVGSGVSDQIASILRGIATSAEEKLGGMIRALEEGVANMMVREHHLWSMIEKEEGGALQKELSAIQGFIRDQRSKKLINSVESQTDVWRAIGKGTYKPPAPFLYRQPDVIQTVGVDVMKKHIADKRDVFSDPTLVLAEMPAVQEEDTVITLARDLAPPTLMSVGDLSSSAEDDDHTADQDDISYDDNTFLTGTHTDGVSNKTRRTVTNPDADLDNLEALLVEGLSNEGHALSETEVETERRRIAHIRLERRHERQEKNAKREARRQQRTKRADERARAEAEENEFKRRITGLQQSALLQDICCHDLLPLLHNDFSLVTQDVRRKLIMDVFDKVCAFERGIKSKVSTIARALYSQVETANAMMEAVPIPTVFPPPSVTSTTSGAAPPTQQSAVQDNTLFSVFALKRAHLSNPLDSETTNFKNNEGDVDAVLASVAPDLRDEYNRQQNVLSATYPLLHALYQDHTLLPASLPMHATQHDDAPLETLLNACENVVPITRLLMEKISILGTLSSGGVSPQGRSPSLSSSTPRDGMNPLQIAVPQLNQAIRVDLPPDISGLPSLSGAALGLSRQTSQARMITRRQPSGRQARGANSALSFKDRLAKAMAVDADKLTKSEKRQDPIVAVQVERAAMKNHLWGLLGATRQATSLEVEAEKAKKAEMRRMQKKRLKKKRRMDEESRRRQEEKAVLAMGNEPAPTSNPPTRKKGRGKNNKSRLSIEEEGSDVEELNTNDMSTSDDVVTGRYSPGKDASSNSDPFDDVELLSDDVPNLANALAKTRDQAGSDSVDIKASMETQRPSLFPSSVAQSVARASIVSRPSVVPPRRGTTTSPARLVNVSSLLAHENTAPSLIYADEDGGRGGAAVSSPLGDNHLDADFILFDYDPEVDVVNTSTHGDDTASNASSGASFTQRSSSESISHNPTADRSGSISFSSPSTQGLPASPSPPKVARDRKGRMSSKSVAGPGNAEKMKEEKRLAAMMTNIAVITEAAQKLDTHSFATAGSIEEFVHGKVVGAMLRNAAALNGIQARNASPPVKDDAARKHQQSEQAAEVDRPTVAVSMKELALLRQRLQKAEGERDEAMRQQLIQQQRTDAAAGASNPTVTAQIQALNTKKAKRNDTFSFDHWFSITDVAKLFDVDTSEMRALNPALPPSLGDFDGLDKAATSSPRANPDVSTKHAGFAGTGDGDIVLRIPISVTMASRVFDSATPQDDDIDPDASSEFSPRGHRLSTVSPIIAGDDLRKSHAALSHSSSMSFVPENSRKPSAGLLAVGTGSFAEGRRSSSNTSSVHRKSYLDGLISSALSDNSVLKAAAVKQYHDKITKRQASQASPVDGRLRTPSAAAVPLAQEHDNHRNDDNGNSGSSSSLDSNNIPPLPAPPTESAAGPKKGKLRIKSTFHRKLLHAILRTQHDIITTHAKEEKARDTKDKQAFVEATIAAGGRDEKGRMVSEWGKYVVEQSRADGSYALERKVAPARARAASTSVVASLPAAGLWRSVRLVDRSTSTADDTVLSLAMLPQPTPAGQVAQMRHVRIDPSQGLSVSSGTTPDARSWPNEIGRLNHEFDLVTRAQRARRRVFLRQRYLHHYHRSATADGVARAPIRENPNGLGYLVDGPPSIEKQMASMYPIPPRIAAASSSVLCSEDDSPLSTRARRHSAASTQPALSLSGSLRHPAGTGAVTRANTARPLSADAANNRSAFLAAEMTEAMHLLNVPAPKEILDRYLTAPIVVSAQCDDLAGSIRADGAKSDPRKSLSTADLPAPLSTKTGAIQALRRIVALFGLHKAESGTNYSGGKEAPKSEEGRMAALLSAVYRASLPTHTTGGGGALERPASEEDEEGILVEAAVKAVVQYKEGTIGGYEQMLCIPRSDLPQPSSSAEVPPPPKPKKGPKQVPAAVAIPTRDVGDDEVTTPASLTPGYLWERFTVDLDDVLFNEELARIMVDREEDAQARRRSLRIQHGGDHMGLNMDGTGGAGGASEWTMYFSDLLQDFIVSPEEKARLDALEMERRERKLAARADFEEDLTAKASFLLNVRLPDVIHVGRYLCGIERFPSIAESGSVGKGGDGNKLPTLKERFSTLLQTPYPNEKLPYPTCTDADEIMAQAEAVTRLVSALAELALAPPVSSLTPFQARRLMCAASGGELNGSTLGIRSVNMHEVEELMSPPNRKDIAVSVVASSTTDASVKRLQAAILYKSATNGEPLTVTSERREWVFIPPQAFITHELSPAEVERFYVNEDSSVNFMNATSTVSKNKNAAAYLAELYPGVGAASIVYWNTGGRNPFHQPDADSATSGFDGDLLLDPLVMLADLQRGNKNPAAAAEASKPLYDQYSSGFGFLNPVYASKSKDVPVRFRIPVQDREQFVARVLWQADQLRRRHVQLLTVCLRERRQVEPEGLAWLSAVVQLPLDHLRAVLSLSSRAQKMFYHDCGYGGLLGGVGLPVGLVLDDPAYEDGAVWDAPKAAKRRPKRAVSSSSDSDDSNEARSHRRSFSNIRGLETHHVNNPPSSVERPSIFPPDGGDGGPTVGVATRKMQSIERHMERLKRVRAMGTHIVTEIAPGGRPRHSEQSAVMASDLINQTQDTGAQGVRFSAFVSNAPSSFQQQRGRAAISPRNRFGSNRPTPRISPTVRGSPNSRPVATNVPPAGRTFVGISRGAHLIGAHVGPPTSVASGGRDISPLLEVRSRQPSLGSIPFTQQPTPAAQELSPIGRTRALSIGRGRQGSIRNELMDSVDEGFLQVAGSSMGVSRRPSLAGGVESHHLASPLTPFMPIQSQHPYVGYYPTSERREADKSTSSPTSESPLSANASPQTGPMAKRISSVKSCSSHATDGKSPLSGMHHSVEEGLMQLMRPSHTSAQNINKMRSAMGHASSSSVTQTLDDLLAQSQISPRDSVGDLVKARSLAQSTSGKKLPLRGSPLHGHLQAQSPSDHPPRQSSPMVIMGRSTVGPPELAPSTTSKSFAQHEPHRRHMRITGGGAGHPGGPLSVGSESPRHTGEGQRSTATNSVHSTVRGFQHRVGETEEISIIGGVSLPRRHNGERRLSTTRRVGPFAPAPPAASEGARGGGPPTSTRLPTFDTLSLVRPPPAPPEERAPPRAAQPQVDTLLHNAISSHLAAAAPQRITLNRGHVRGTSHRFGPSVPSSGAPRVEELVVAGAVPVGPTFPSLFGPNRPRPPPEAPALPTRPQAPSSAPATGQAVPPTGSPPPTRHVVNARRLTPPSIPPSLAFHRDR